MQRSVAQVDCLSCCLSFMHRQKKRAQKTRCRQKEGQQSEDYADGFFYLSGLIQAIVGMPVVQIDCFELARSAHARLSPVRQAGGPCENW